MVPLVRISSTQFLVGSICALMLAGTCGLAGAASSKTSATAISARLTKTSFKPVQAGSVKLIYKFSKPSESFSYLLTSKKGSKWQTVKSFEKKGTFKGSKSMTVKKVFAGKSVKVGSYRLKLSADGGSKLLSFKVVSEPTITSRPTISGTTTQGQALTAGKGSWINSPTSYVYQWQRCNSSGASCSDISVATNSTYTLVLADAGSTIRVVVKASNAYGSASAISAQTAVVASLPGFTRDNPIPLGQSASTGDGWIVTVTTAYPNATSAVLAANMFNTAPPAGYQDYMIAVSATYTGSGSSHLWSGYSMRAVGASNVAYTTFDNDCGVLPDPNLDLDDPEVFTGGTVGGNAACWQVSSSDAGTLEMYVKPLISDTITWFSLR